MAIVLTLLASALLSLGGLAYAVWRAIALWRSTKRTLRTFGPVLAGTASTGAEIEVQVQRAQAAAERLRDAAAQLQRSRTRLDAQLGAVSGAVRQVKRLLWFVPGA